MGIIARRPEIDSKRRADAIRHLEDCRQFRKGRKTRGVGDFFGEGCLIGQPLRMETADAATECTVIRLEKSAMAAVLRDEPVFSALFVSYLLTRNIRIEENLVDQLFNSSENAWRGFSCCWPMSAASVGRMQIRPTLLPALTSLSGTRGDRGVSHSNCAAHLRRRWIASALRRLRARHKINARFGG